MAGNLSATDVYPNVGAANIKSVAPATSKIVNATKTPASATAQAVQTVSANPALAVMLIIAGFVAYRVFQEMAGGD